MSLRVRDVAARLNVSEKTVYKWLRAGLIPARRIGKTWIITEESIQAVLSPKITPSTAVGTSSIAPGSAPLSPVIRTSLPGDPLTSDIDTLNRFTGILSGAVNHGVLGILGPR